MKIKSNKYHNTKVIYKGIKFDSKKERDRYIQLKQLHSLGIIESLELQPKFLLLDTIHYKGKTYPKTYYKADFKYFDNKKGKYIVEDVKSPITAKDKVYRLKIKILLTKRAPWVIYLKLLKKLQASIRKTLPKCLIS